MRQLSFVCRFFVALLVGASAGNAATIVVNTLADVDGADGLCSLREAILAANGNVPRFECPAGSGNSDRITITVAGTIELTSGLPTVSQNVAIAGPGRDLLTIDGMQLHRPFRFTASSVQQYVLRDLTLARGNNASSSGGCLSAPSVEGSLAMLDVTVRDCVTGRSGGGMTSSGPLWLERVWFDGNIAENSGGGGGGAVTWEAAASLVIVDSAFTDNASLGPVGTGGALRAAGSGVLSISGSTFSGNRANYYGGAIAVVPPGSALLEVFLVDSTLWGNESDFDADASEPTGGTLYFNRFETATVTAEISNSILAAGVDNSLVSTCPEILVNTAEPAIQVVSNGQNLIADGSCVAAQFPASPGAGLPNTNGDFVGTSGAPLDPRLGPLVANGGPTPTHMPLAETPHPVIDQGRCPNTELDQRGYGNANTNQRARDVATVPNNPAGDGCDIGSVERGAVARASQVVFVDGFESGTTLFWSAEAP